MKSLKEFCSVGGTRSHSGDGRRKAIYGDIEGKEKRALDKICMKKFGRIFVDCSWEEQSAARSAYYQANKDPEGIEDAQDEITQDKEDAKGEDDT